jgi:hypothetical protein
MAALSHESEKIFPIGRSAGKLSIFHATTQKSPGVFM